MAQEIGEELGAALLAMGVICVFIGGLAVWLIPILWGWVKPFIHNLTA